MEIGNTGSAEIRIIRKKGKSEIDKKPKQSVPTLCDWFGSSASPCDSSFHYISGT